MHTVHAQPKDSQKPSRRNHGISEPGIKPHGDAGHKQQSGCQGECIESSVLHIIAAEIETLFLMKREQILQKGNSLWTYSAVCFISVTANTSQVSGIMHSM